jgi:endonuclease YncB( thermonuclease family)
VCFAYPYLAALVATFLLSACASCPACPNCATCPPCPACPPCEEKAGKADSHTWFVYRVIDGDTIVVLQEAPERKETVRLLNINTPERKATGFEEAREALKYLVRGGYVTLAFDKPGVEKRDGFGRLLAYVIVKETNANIEIVRQGWSKFYTKYGRGRFSEQFKHAEKEAKDNHRGLWGM